jgi:hypothetical protein
MATLATLTSSCPPVAGVCVCWQVRGAWDVHRRLPATRPLRVGPVRVHAGVVWVSRAFPSWNRSILTEIYLCHACSYHETEDGNAREGMATPARWIRPPHLQRRCLPYSCSA